MQFIKKITKIKSLEVKDIKTYDKERIRLSLITISEVITDWAITKEIEKSYEELKNHFTKARARQMELEKPAYMG